MLFRESEADDQEHVIAAATRVTWPIPGVDKCASDADAVSGADSCH